MLSVSNWLRNAEISKDLKLRTKGTKSSIFYVDRTVSHSCHLPLCRVCLSQLDTRRGMGEMGRWLLGEYCVHRKALSLSTLVFVCVCGRGHVSISWIPRKEFQSAQTVISVFWALELLFWELLMPWDIGEGCRRMKTDPRERMPGKQLESPLLDVANLCAFSVFWVMGTFLWQSYLKIWVEICFFHCWPFIFHHCLENCFLSSYFNRILLKAQCSRQKGFC